MLCNITYEGASPASIQAYTANTWYDLYIEFDTNTDQCRFKVGSGSWTSWITARTAETALTGVSLFYGQSTASEVTAYWDDIALWVPTATTSATTTTYAPVTSSYTYAGTNYANPHAATQIGSTTYAYDNAGNMSSAGTSTYTYDHNQRMTQSVYGNATSTYLYDHTGARVRVVNGTTTSYFTKRYQQTNGGYQKTKNIYAGGQLVATLEKRGTASVIPYYVSSDNLSSVTMLTNASGTATQTLDYFPFGDIRVNNKNTSFDSQRKYVGQINDASTNLDYLNARYFDATRGQFTSQDPLSKSIALNPTAELLLNPQAQNFYSYANNNPIRLSDPSGEAATAAQMNMASNIGMAIVSSYISGNITFAQASGFLGQLGGIVQSWGGTGGSSNGLNQNAASAKTAYTSATTGGGGGGSNPTSASVSLFSRSIGIDKPGALMINSSNQGAYGNVIDAIKKSKEFNTYVGEKVKSRGGGGSIDIRPIDSENSMKFSSGDLFTSLHKVNAGLSGTQSADGSWNLQVNITDNYNFEWQGSNGPVAGINDAAYLGQQAGVIQNYPVNINFNYSYRP